MTDQNAANLYPKMKYHPEHGTAIAKSAEHEQAMEGWFDHPSQFPLQEQAVTEAPHGGVSCAEFDRAHAEAIELFNTRWEELTGEKRLLEVEFRNLSGAYDRLLADFAQLQREKDSLQEQIAAQEEEAEGAPEESAGTSRKRGKK